LLQENSQHYLKKRLSCGGVPMPMAPVKEDFRNGAEDEDSVNPIPDVTGCRENLYPGEMCPCSSENTSII